VRFVRWLTALLVCACGGSRHAGPVSVTITPPAATVEQGATQTFVAHVTGADLPIAWSLAEGAGAGSIGADGTYTAPTAAGSYHVVARAGAATATATVSVPQQNPPPVTPATVPSVSPAIAALEPGASIQFTATVPVSWSADGGTIDATGTYIAPQAPGWYHVAAVSTADATKRASAAVYVAAGVTVAIAPATPRLEAGAQQQFVAAAAGNDPRVTWAVVETGGGSIDAAGLYNAPRAAGVYHVVATSAADPSRSARAEITVVVPPVSVTMSPAALTVKPGATLQFHSAAAGLPDTRLSWSSDCCANVAQDGSFVAPGTPGTYHLVARSVADPAQFASATIVVRAGAAIDPAAVTLAAGDQIAFHATDPSTTWTVQEGAHGGNIVNGVYQAPHDHGGTFHVVATGQGWTATAQVDVLPADVVDRGGPVVATTRTFAVFWGDPSKWPDDVRPTQEAVLRGLNGSDYFKIANEYLRGASGATAFGGSFTLTSAPPASPDKADNQTIGAAACAALQAGGVTVAPGDMAFVYGSALLAPVPSWCAWHSYAVCGGTTLLIAFIPNVAGSYGCLKLGASAGCNGLSEDANATASLTAHELLEAMTDPVLTTWTDAAGAEIGDKCEEETRCIALPTGSLQLQTEWSNAVHACAP
jgi:plastocyanin